MNTTVTSLFPKRISLVFALLAALPASCLATLTPPPYWGSPTPLVGTLPGEFSVDNKGAANYTIPLQIPPGRAGMQPQLALHYNSNGGNGPLGIGFSLSTGFPQSITRGRSILARDGVVRGVKFDADDKLYLDGKRLICTSGAYGQPGSAYRTEVDSFVTITSFGTGDNIEGFRMTTKDGTMLCFGKSVKDAANATVYSETDGYHMLGGETTGRAFAWALKWVEDTVGNYIEFKYNESDATSQAVSFGEGEHVLASMRYAGNRRLSISPQFKVSLRYNDPQDPPASTLRPDGGVSYRYGRKTVMNSRLDRIIVHASASSASSPIRVYSLKYKTSPEHASLKLETVRLEDYSADVSSTRATELTWGDTPGQLGDVTSLYSGTNLWFASMPQYIGDFNGDGRKDVLGRKMTTKPSSSYSASANFTHFASGADNKTLVETPVARPDGITAIANSSTHMGVSTHSGGDINGDGKTDLVFKVNDTRIPGGADGWYVALATGSGFAPTVTKVIDGNPTGSSTSQTFASGPDVIADIDGDGLDDLIYRKSTNRVVFSFAAFGGDAGHDMSDPSVVLMYMMGISSYNVTIPHYSLYVKSPVVSSGSLGYSNEYTIPTPTIYHFGILSPSTAYLPMDFNGDGLTDFLATEMTYGYKEETDYGWPCAEKSCLLWALINTGSKTLEAKLLNGGDGTFPTYPHGVPGKFWDWREQYPEDDPYGAGASTYMIGDVNGDGLDDIVFFRLRVKMRKGYYNSGEPEPVNGWTVFLSKGDGTFDSDSFSAPPESVTVGDRDNVPTYYIRAGGISGKMLNGFDVRGVILMDYNNDGKKDFVWHADAQAGWQCLLATSDGFAQTPIAIQSPPSQGTAPFDYYRIETNLGWPVFSASNFSFLTQATDMDGDGRDDILLLEHTGASINPVIRNMYCIFSPDSNANRLVAVKDGLGAETRIEYTPITRDSVYTPGVPVSYPIREDRRPQSVVSDIYKDSGSDNSADHAHFSYQYSGNRLDLSGRGSLGFHSFVTLDHQTNLFKYQFLTQSFPMTGLAMREQTYRFWENGSQTNFRLITSHDNTVVFDEVANSANSTAWGTVYPFISKAIESRWEDSTTAHYTLASAAPPSQPESIFTRAKPSGAHITITAESHFDKQTATQTTLPGLYNPSDLATSGTTSANTVTGYLNYSTFHALAFPRKITHGNLTRLATDFGDGFTETATTTYHAPTANGITGLIDRSRIIVTSTAYGTEATPTKYHTYSTIASAPTPLVATELTSTGVGTLITSGVITNYHHPLSTTITYTRDALGRVIETSLSDLTNTSDPRYIGSYTTSQATAFDARFDLPTTTLNAYGHDTATAYHDTLGLPVSVTDVNGAQTTTDYDALGRVTQTRNELLDLQTDTTYAWTTDTATDWKAVQTVTPPANYPGALTLSSVFAIRTAATAQPAVTTYHDRLGRPIRITKEGFNGQLIHTDTIYNNLGQTVATSLPYPAGATPLWTKTTYDPFGRVATITTPNGAITTNTYAGRATAVTIDAPDRDPQTNVTLVDAKGRTIKVWNADNAPTPASLDPLTGSSTEASIEYKLDGFGRMRETKLRGQTQTITATYDALGRQTSLDDPDKGGWTYINNALGQVVSQTDAKGNVTTSTFDRLARPLTRITAEAASGPIETARWYYFDTAADTDRHLIAQGNKGWIGALQREESITTGAPGHAAATPATTTAYYYDDQGRPEITLRLIDNKWYYTNTAYDQYNRIAQISHFWRPATDEYGGQDPLAWEDFGYTYTYDTRSYLLALHDTTDQARPWWEADATSGYDHLDRPVLVRKGNAHWTQRTYRPEDGVITNIKTGPNAGSTTIQNLTYNFDGLGNLTTRANGSLTETFAYDNLNRLTTRNGTTIAAYAINGNITSKTDVSGNTSGSYTYSTTKPHAVTNAWGHTMTYDANGNLLTRTGNSETWTTRWTGFDKPRWLAKTGGSSTTGSEFLYNANRSRVMHLEFDAMTNGVPSHYTRKKIYAAGPDVEIDYQNTSTSIAPIWTRDKVRIYINAPDGPVGTAEFTSTLTINLNSPDKALVYHTDHLGSIESITTWGDTTTTLALDDTNKPSRYSYDPWGGRRNPFTWTGKPTTTDPGGHEGTASRGFTSHEMLDGLGLVHMNGRIYDQLLGRFLSADPVIPGIYNLQAYNRYTYGLNNPLRYIDPTGKAPKDAAAGAIEGTLNTGAQTLDAHAGNAANTAGTTSIIASVFRFLGADRIANMLDASASQYQSASEANAEAAQSVRDSNTQTASSLTGSTDPNHPHRVAARIAVPALGSALAGAALTKAVDKVVDKVGTSPTNVKRVNDAKPAPKKGDTVSQKPAPKQGDNTEVRGGPYGKFEDPPSAGPGKPFTKAQKEKIYKDNKARNGGILRDDRTGEELIPSVKSESGVTPHPNEAQIDHVYPRSEGGPNTYSNAEVRSRANNMEKSNEIE